MHYARWRKWGDPLKTLVVWGPVCARGHERKPKGTQWWCPTCDKDSQRLRLYGITVNQYEALLADQDGRCAICQGRPRKKRLAVDHNHKTGEVRGLLCSRCNHRMLGGAKEDPEILRRAAGYLESPPARRVLGG